jgi:hypothetical protein
VPKKRAARKPPKKKAKFQDSNPDASEMDEDDKPLVSAKKPSARGKRKVKVESEDDDDAPLVKKPASTKARGKTVKKEEGSDAEVSKPKKRGSKAKKEDDGGEEPLRRARRRRRKRRKMKIFTDGGTTRILLGMVRRSGRHCSIMACTSPHPTNPFRRTLR